ncbi:MAG: OmpA family protein [Deltaproteobacteria bacterium]|nr:OmpA family protein [Deltaproteobacteria bacterium]
MARKKKKGGGGFNPLGWMVTFSDLITLLLTFFVLLITMSSMDQKTVREAFGLFAGGSGPLAMAASGKLTELTSIIENTELVPFNTLMENKRIKDIIFEFDDPTYDRIVALMDKDIKVTVSEKGVAIELANYILFNEGDSELRLENLPLLHRLAEVLRGIRYPTSIEGHTDGSEAEGGTTDQAWRLSLARAMSVLEYFIEDEGLFPDRFRVGGLGPSKPLYDKDYSVDKSKNRRIVIVIYKEQFG